MTNSMFCNGVINWFFLIGATGGFIYLVVLSLDKKPLFGDNDVRRDLENDASKDGKRFFKAQKKALKAATKRAKA